MMKKMVFLTIVIFPVLGFSQRMDSVAVIRQVDSLLNIAEGFLKAGKPKDAMPFSEAARDLAKINLGEIHEKYAMCLTTLGGCYYQMGRYKETESLYLEAKSIREKTAGKEHLDYAVSLSNLAVLYWKVGSFEKAESPNLEAKAIREKILGKKHPLYAHSLNNLALLYMAMSNYEKAEPFYLEAITIREKTLGNGHTDYAASLNNLAILYRVMGNYEKAEPLFLEAKAILGKNLGKEHPYYVGNLSNQAILYRNMGNYEKAKSLYLEVNAIREKTLGKEHPDYGEGLTNLAVLYRTMGNYEQAEILSLEAKTICEKAFGSAHLRYAHALNNLAALYGSMGRYEKAEPLLLEALAIIVKTLGKESLDFAKNLQNLAILYSETSSYEKAEPLYLEAQAIYEKTLGKRHPDYAATLNNLAVLYQALGNYKQAETLFEELAYLNQSFLTNTIHYLSERELNKYLHTFSKAQAETLSFAQSADNGSPISTACYDNILFYKGFLLNASNRIKRLARSDSITTERYNLLKSYERRLAAEYAKPIAERKNALELEAKANDLEKELARTVAGYDEAMQQPRWRDVQQKLQAGEAAVEFVHYRYYGKKRTDSILYAALVLRPGDPAPQFVPLFEEGDIAPLLKSARGGNFLKINALYAFQPAGGAQKSLYELVWEPLEEQLQGVKTVYCAPSGLLHRLNLGAIPVNENQRLAELFHLVCMGSTRQLVLSMSTKAAGNDGYLVGGVRYVADNSAPASVNSNAVFRGQVSHDELPFHADSTGRGGSWDYLPGTATEALDISRVLQAASFGAQLDTGFLATEEAFRSLGTGKPSPRILHIATHGFFFPDPASADRTGRQNGGLAEPVFKMSEHPMIRSGLILAGAQQAWATGKAPAHREDGILTAYEISQMNLSNTELVVLSACETGLGDLAGNEGVYGLQRAFKIAGAKYLIMSLWKVNDQATRELMTDFYRQWLIKGMDIPAAFDAAQHNLKKKYPEAPFYWAGFVLVE